MHDTVFEGCAQAPAQADFKALEGALERPLPDAFKQHYLRWNGGAPTDTLVPGDGVWEATEVAMFFSIRHPLPGLDPGSTVLAHCLAMRERRLIPEHFLPFAWDPGGNLFGLDLRDETVAYYPTDLFDPQLGAAGNYKAAARTVASSFASFLDSLAPNPDADW